MSFPPLPLGTLPAPPEGMHTHMAAPEEQTAETHVAISGELSDLLIELASGLKRACVFGPRNPAVQEAASSFVKRFSGRRGSKGALSIAVAGSNLIVEVRAAGELRRRFGGVTTGREHPLLGALADRLTRHETGEIILAENVTPQEIAAVLGFLSTDPAQTGRPLGREGDEKLDSVPNIRIHPGRATLELSHESEDATAAAQEDEQMWAEFAAAALGLPESEVGESHSPAAIAAALSGRSGNGAFDRRVTAHLQAISSRLATAGPLESTELARRFSDVLRRIDRGTLRTLLAMSGDLDLQSGFLRASITVLDVDVVFELLQAAAETEDSQISRWMLRLLSKLAMHAQASDGAVAHRSEESLREQFRALITGWDLDTPNPDDYEEALTRLSAARGESAGAETALTQVPPRCVVELALEVGRDGLPLRSAVEDMIAAGEVATLTDHLTRAPDEDLARVLWARLAERPILYRLIEDDDPDWDVIDLVLPHAGVTAAEPLLDRLAEADQLALRRRVFDRLMALGPAVVKPAVRCLGHPSSTPWFVLRNVLSLLAKFEDWPVAFDPWELTGHENPQVRLEAMKLCLRMPEAREKAIVRALKDSSSRIVALGIAEAEKGYSMEAEPFLIDVATSREGEYLEFRSHAIRALGSSHSAEALGTLLTLASPKRRGSRKSMRDEGPEVLAALRGLATGWSSDPRARALLERARASRRPAIREAAS